MPAKRSSPDSASLPSSFDVAHLAGVSRTAVSYVLNGVPNHVSEETRARILQAASELGYQIQTSASALRRGYSNEISMSFDITWTPFVSEMLGAMQTKCLELGYTLVVYFNIDATPKQHGEILQKIFARRPLALIANNLYDQDIARQAHKAGIQHVVLLSLLYAQSPEAHTIIFPTREAGYLAARHLIERGHRHLALVHPEDPIQAPAFRTRLEGMQQAIAGIPDARIDILPLELNMPSIHEVVAYYFNQPSHATGIYAYSDDYAIPLISALAQQNLQVPNDIAIVGTDNVKQCEFLLPPLTSIRFDSNNMGTRAIMIIDALCKGVAPTEELTLPLVPELIVRSSS